MSIKTHDTQPANDPNTARRPNRTRRLIASVAATAITAGGGAALYIERSGGGPNSASHSVGNPKTPPTKTPEKTPPPTAETTKNPGADGQKTIEQLPGFGTQVSEQQREMLKASTVEVVTLKKDTSDSFSTESLCTGIKVTVGDGTYVATARHCFLNGLDAINYYPQINTSQDRAHDPALNQAEIIPESARGKVSIWTIGAGGNPDAKDAIPVSSVAASYYPDMALLEVGKSSSAARKFDALPAISYEAAIGSEPAPGAQAVIYSMPMTASKLVETKGTYLGTSADPGDSARSLSWVLIDRSDADKNGCFDGASGAVAVIGGAGITGPLTLRNQPGEIAGEKARRTEIAASLGIDLENNNTTLCGFSVMTPDLAQGAAQVASAQ